MVVWAIAREVFETFYHRPQPQLYPPRDPGVQDAGVLQPAGACHRCLNQSLCSTSRRGGAETGRSEGDGLLRRAHRPQAAANIQAGAGGKGQPAARFYAQLRAGVDPQGEYAPLQGVCGAARCSRRPVSRSPPAGRSHCRIGYSPPGAARPRRMMTSRAYWVLLLKALPLRVGVTTPPARVISKPCCWLVEKVEPVTVRLLPGRQGDARGRRGYCG